MNPSIDDSIEAAGVFRALSDPFRLHIFTAISGRSREAKTGDEPPVMPMAEVVEDIARSMNTSPDHVEQHILELSRVRLVSVGEDADGRLTVAVNAELVDRVRRLAAGSDDA